MSKFPVYPPLTAPDGLDEALYNDQSDSNKTKRFSLTGLKNWLASVAAWVGLSNIDLTTFPAFLAYPSVGPTLTGGAAAIILACNTEVYDQGNCYNNASYTFTAPATGVYEFFLFVTGSNGTSSRPIPALKIGATTYNGSQTTDTFGSGYCQLQIKLTAGDTVVPYVSANPSNIPIAAAVVSTRFSGRRVA